MAAALCSHDVLAVVLVLLPTTLKHASVSASMGARAAPQKFLRVAVRARSLVRVAVASCCPQLLCTFFQQTLFRAEHTTSSDECLGSSNDEGRSEVR